MTRKRLERQFEALFSDAGTPEPEPVLEEPRGQETLETLAGLPQAPPSAGETPGAEGVSVESTQGSLEDSNGQRDLMTFRLGEQTYALPIEPLEQIIEMVTITPIPQLDGSVEGVINIRGRAVPVVNLRRHFDLPGIPLQLRTPIILAQIDECTVGLIVDEVIDVLRLSGSQIRRTGDFLPQGLGAVPLLQGLAHTPEGTVLLLDPEHLFRPDEREVLAQVAGTVSGAVSRTVSGAVSRTVKEESLLECPVLPELMRRAKRPQARQAAMPRSEVVVEEAAEEMPLSELEVEGAG